MLDCQNVKSLKLYIAKMLHNQNVKVPQCKSVKMLLCHIVNTFLLKWNPAAGEHGRRLMTQRSWVRSQSLNITFS